MHDQTFCDWLTVSQEHQQHDSICDVCVTTDRNGLITDQRRVPRSVQFKHGSSVRVFSDGSRVQFSGNPSRVDRLDNYHGISVDKAKAKANAIMRQIGLPEFTAEAKFSRVDITCNLAAGKNQRAYMRELQGRSLGQLDRTVTEGNVYYGVSSRHRKVRVYDKARELKEVQLRGLRGSERDYVEQLAKWCEASGVVRIEAQYMRWLTAKNMRDWENVTHSKMAEYFRKEIDDMQKIEVLDLDNVPMPYLGTLTMYMAGVDPKTVLHRNTYTKHRKELKKLGYDIGSNVPTPLRAQRQVIVLTPAGTPDFYRHAEDTEKPDLKEV